MEGCMLPHDRGETRDECQRTRVVKLLGNPAGKMIADRVSSIDVMLTVFDLAGVRAQLCGASLVPALKGAPIRRDVFFETDYREYTYKRSVVTPDGWKLIYTLESCTRELYDLTDRAEVGNRAEPGVLVVRRKLAEEVTGQSHFFRVSFAFR